MDCFDTDISSTFLVKCNSSLGETFSYETSLGSTTLPHSKSAFAIVLDLC